MSHNSDRSPELHRPQNPSIYPLSDSEPELEPDFDIDVDHPPPIFYSSPDHNHHHFRHDVTFTNAFFHRPSTSTGPQSGPYFGPGWPDPQSYSLSDERGSGVNLELGLGFEFGGNCDDTPRFEGLRPVNLDSDSDSEDGILHDYDYDFDNNNDHDDNNNIGFGGVSDFDRPPFCWDYLGFNSNRNHDTNDTNIIGGNDDDVDDDFLYDEVQSLAVESDNVDTGVSNLFDAYQEREEQRDIAIESEDDELGGELGVEDAIRDLEWEILLAVNNFNREVYDMDFNVDMYEAILGEVEERMNEWRGSPPASIAVIESLPSVKLSTDVGFKENEVVCAICRDEVSKEEVVRELPCLHYYHGDCILPWLKLRNTCPVCRYELPTDDAEYEFRKREREGVYDDAIDDNDELTLDSQEASTDTLDHDRDHDHDHTSISITVILERKIRHILNGVGNTENVGQSVIEVVTSPTMTWCPETGLSETHFMGVMHPQTQKKVKSSVDVHANRLFNKAQDEGMQGLKVHLFITIERVFLF